MRGLSTHKKEEQEKLAKQVEQFLNNGGEIESVQNGESGLGDVARKMTREEVLDVRRESSHKRAKRAIAKEQRAKPKSEDSVVDEVQLREAVPSDRNGDPS